MSDFVAQIRAVLDTSQAEAQLKTLQKNQKIKINVELAGEAAKLLNGQLPNITANATKTGQAVGKGYSTALQKQIETIAKTQRNAFSSPLNSLTKQQKAYSDWWNKELGKQVNANYGKNQQLKAFDDYTKQLQIRAEKVSQIQRRVSQGYLDVETSGIRKSLNKYSGTDSNTLKSAEASYKKLISLQKELTTGISDDKFKKTLSDKDIISKYKQYSDIYEKMKNQLKVLGNESTNTSKAFNSLEALTASNKTLTYLKNNTKAMKQYGDAFKDLATRQRAATSTEELRQYNAEYRNLVSNVQKDGLTGKSFFHEIGSGISRIGQFVGTYAILQKGIQTLKQMARAVLDVDTAMTNLYKVTDETSGKYNEFLNNAGKTSKEIGRDISSYITQTSEWAKLGYNMDQSANLAKISSIYSNVGEVDDKTAVSDLVTVLKAYNMDDSQAINIVDQLNELGNTYATDAKSLGDGLKNMASTMAMSGVSLEKSLAILTGGTEITQDAGELGNAIKVAVLRMRGQKGALEDIGEYTDDVESVSKMQTQILKMTKGAVNIMDASDPTSFRDYYDVMSDIAEVLPKLNETDQANLIETLFGKNRANQGQAILQAFQSGQIQKAYQTALNAEGSAQKEQDRWMESLEARIQVFKASFQELSNTAFQSDFLKGAVDSGTALLEVLTKIIDVGGGIPALLATIAGVKLFTNLDLFYY